MNTDMTSSPKLSERQLHVLSALIRFYTEHGEPISSKQLSEQTELNVSSATIRNELGVLEQLGMIRAPHTSAGRIPTEEGYRYFVRHLIADKDLPPSEKRLIRAEFEQAAHDVQKWVKTAANVLARRTQTAAVVTEPRHRSARFKHLQLVATHGHLVLMILVLDGGKVLQHMLTLEDVPDQERLSQAAQQINALCLGDTAFQIQHKALQQPDELIQDILELVADVLSEAGTMHTLHLYGFGDLVSRLEEGESTQQALRILDENQILSNLLMESIESPIEPVRVLVGGDGRFDKLSELSVVVGRYGTNQLAGAISVLGPTRMRYGRAISTVRYVATLMSAMIQDVYGSED